MAGLKKASYHLRLCFILFVSSVLLLILLSHALRHRQKVERYRKNVLNTTEIPAELIDPSAIDLTPLVNALINSSHSGSRQLFSLLSVTSYSSLALHKLTLLVYNISSVRSIEGNLFRRRFCYCVTNETNDLTDFTAILLDVIGNSTSSLQELFKSTSILSVSQKNNSDCIYICVMAGQMGRELPELWEVASITPVFNQTIVEGPHGGNVSSLRFPLEWHQLPSDLGQVSPSGTGSVSTVRSTPHVSPTTMGESAAETPEVTRPQLPDSAGVGTYPPVTAAGLQPIPTSTQSTRTPSLATVSGMTTAPSRPTTFSTVIRPTRSATESHLARTTTQRHPTRPSAVHPAAGPTAAGRSPGESSWRTTAPGKSAEPERPGCPWTRPELSGNHANATATATTVGAHKLQPCVLELCKFFSQCLCRPFNHRTHMNRFCDDSHLWYQKHTPEVCQRVRRVSFSRNLKQRCLTKMCNKPRPERKQRDKRSPSSSSPSQEVTDDAAPTSGTSAH